MKGMRKKLTRREKDREFSIRKNKLRMKSSKAESCFAKILDNEGIYYIREKGCYSKDGEWCYVDFFIPKYRLAIELDGPEHQTKKARYRDMKKTEFLLHERNIMTYRIKNEDVFRMESIDVKKVAIETYKKHNVSKIKKMAKKVFLGKNSIESSACVMNPHFKKEALTQKIYAYSKINDVIYEFENFFDMRKSLGYKVSYAKYINKVSSLTASSLFIFDKNKEDLENLVEKWYISNF